MEGGGLGNKSYVFCHLFHTFQVPDSLLIFRLFTVPVWISIIITVITAIFAYAILLTLIDGTEEKRKWSINFPDH